MIDTSKGFAIHRTFAASPDEIWSAWTDADAVAQWWHPPGASTPRESVEIDAKVGGHYIYTMVNDASGDSVVTGGIYQEVVPSERLAFTWGYPDGDPADTPIVSITLEEVDGSTSMTFDLRGVDGTKGDGYYYDGWEGVLVSLEGYLDSHHAGAA